LQCHNVSFVAYLLLGYFLHPSELQHCAYIPSCHHEIIVPYPLLGIFHICSIYPRLVVRFLNKIAFYKMGLLVPCPTAQPRWPGYLSYSGLYPLTFQAWVGLLVVKLPPA
jgi:hypothetical protein